MQKTVLMLLLIIVLGGLLRFNAFDFVKAEVSQFDPNVIYVPGNFSTIQEAVNNATSGDTILVANGTYKEQITIDKPLELIGENRSNTIIDANGAGYVVKITSNNVTLSGFAMQNATDSNAWGGIWLNNASNTTIINCAVTRCLFAVWFSNALNSIFRENEFTNNNYDFGFLSGTSPVYFVQNIDTSNTVNGKPIYWLIKQHNLTVPSDAGMVAAINCTDITVKDATFVNNGRSVMLVCTNNSLIENVTTSNSYVGISLLYSYNNIICNNTAYNIPQFGIVLTHSNNNMIYYNNASYCSFNLKLVTSHQNKITTNTLTCATRYHGLVLDAGCLYNIISGNIVSFNENGGIELDDNSDWNTLTHNFIEANMGAFGGIDLSDGSNDNIITENTIINNLIGIRAVSAENTDTCKSTVYKNNFINNTIQTSHDVYTKNHTWDNGSEGNYWSDYAGDDINPHDGIGDTPHIIDSQNQDNYPLMSPYIPGDCNHDSTVNMTDAEMVREAWQAVEGDVNYNPHVDFNMDRIVNIADATIIGLNWLKTFEDP